MTNQQIKTRQRVVDHSEELYAKYGLTDEEIAFIESMIRPMDLNGGDDNGK